MIGTISHENRMSPSRSATTETVAIRPTALLGRAAGTAMTMGERFENLTLTSTRSADNTGVRVQVLRRQPDGSWLRIIDRPEVPQTE